MKKIFFLDNCKGIGLARATPNAKDGKATIHFTNFDIKLDIADYDVKLLRNIADPFLLSNIPNFRSLFLLFS